MSGSRKGGTIGVRTTVALAALAAVALLAVAGPAAAKPQKVVSGTTRMSVPKTQVTALTVQDVALVNISPVSFRFVWAEALSWWFSVPMTSGGSFDYAAGRGTLIHKGGMRFVNVVTNTTLRLTGLRIVFNGPSSVVLTAAVGDAPVTRADIMRATNTPAYRKQGKFVHIDGIQFRLTPQAVLALQTALVGTPDVTTQFAKADVDFKLK
jgi:hypothetical protein